MSWFASSLSNSIRLDDNHDLIDRDIQCSDNDIEFVPSHDCSPKNCNVQGTETMEGIGDKDRYQDEEEDEEEDDEEEDEEEEEEEEEEEKEDTSAKKVKEDLTELGQTLQHQMWGVATFLAPPPPPPPPPSRQPVVEMETTSCERSASNLNDYELSDRSKSGLPDYSEGTLGFGQEFVEIGGAFRSGVIEISKLMGLGYFQFGSEDNMLEVQGRQEEHIGGEGGEDNYDETDGKELEMEEFDDDWAAQAIGITDEVLAFASNISMHPETWLDFPLDEEEDLDDFQMSDVQQLHTSVIEQLVPRLAALRIELCPCHMSQSYFWKVYFVLLHSRLNKHDAELLSTRQVMEARSMWMQELHKHTNPKYDLIGKSSSYIRQSIDATHEVFFTPRAYEEMKISIEQDYETEKHLISSTEMSFIDKFVIKERPIVKKEHKVMLLGSSSKITVASCEYDDEDDWPDAEGSEYGDCKTPISMWDEEDISFSDLEDECVDLPANKQVMK